MRKTVLLVDDSATVRHQLRVALGSAGYACVEAEDGEAGLRELKQATPDALICDVNMPHMSGIELLQELSPSLAKSMPIIMLTTEGSAAQVKQAAGLGANAWVIKPFEPSKLIAALNMLTG